MKKETVFVYFLVIIMLFSVFGTGLLLLADNNSEPDQPTIEELAQQAEGALPAPEVFIPEEDVTELIVLDLVEGSGDEVKTGDVITVHYHGTLASDGSVFDSSYVRGTPATFPLSGLIEGWQRGIPGMKVGGERRLVIPSELGYGEAGTTGIPGGADLVFHIELVSAE